MRSLGTLAAVAGVAVLALAMQPTPAKAKAIDDEVKKAPSFSAKASDGKTYTLESLTKGDKALVLYFISYTCPINMEAAPFFKQIGEAYKGKVNFVGVIDGGPETYKEWNKEFGLKYPVLYDPDNKIIQAYKAEASPWIIVVNPSGEIEKTYKGYSDKSLQELSDRMAKHGKTKSVKINVKGAPDFEMYG